MPSISQRGITMPESPIRKLAPYAEAAKKKGKTIYHLNIGQPDIKTPESAIQAIKNIDLDILEYSHSAGNESYRRKLADNYQKKGIDINFKDLLVTTGGSEALLLAFSSCLDAGDEIIIPEPFYANYNGFATALDIIARPVTSSIDTGFKLPPMERFEKLITRHTKGILICNPGNPTGTLYTSEELQALRDIIKKHDLFLFADEVYREFCYDDHEHVSVMNLEGIEDNTIMVDSVSKRYSMCGARIGTLISRNEEVISTALKFAQARLSPPTLAQIAAEAALDTPSSYFENVRAEYEERRNVLIEGLNKIEGVTCPTPGGAFYCFAELPVDDSDRFCQWLLEDFEYENETVMLAPAAGFYATEGLGKRQVRIAYVLNIDSLKRSVMILDKALKIYPGRQVKTDKATGMEEISKADI